MNIPSPLAKKLESVRKAKNLTTEELTKFMKRHGFDEKELAELLGITPQAVRLWTTGQREISITNTRLVRLLDKHPTLMRDFRDF